MRIGVIGACAWGTALAQVAAANGDPVLIWAFEEEVARAINETHCNRVFLPGNDLNSAIQATTSLDDLSVCDAVLVVTPAQHLGGSEEHTSELQSLMRISYAVFCLKKKNTYIAHMP